MSASPTYFGTVCTARAQVSVANTARDGSGTLATPAWGGSGGAGAPTTDWSMKRLVISETGDLADSVITVFTTDGITILFLTDVDIANPAASSTMATGLVTEVVYFDYTFPAGWDLRFGITVAPSSGIAVVTVFAERA